MLEDAQDANSNVDIGCTHKHITAYLMPMQLTVDDTYQQYPVAFVDLSVVITLFERHLKHQNISIYTMDHAPDLVPMCDVMFCCR